jgi:hypothetical protein
MAEMSDYGSASAETALVPQSLTVFRHFFADTYMSWLMRMGFGMTSERNYRILRHDYPAKVADGVHVAKCRKSVIGAAAGYTAYTDHSTHQAPQVDCKCGFYAHYDPGTDFYPSHNWGTDYAKDMYGDQDYGDLVIVRAVCEAQGRVVMGRLGVRAEKMRIVGLAIDWDKHLWHDEREEIPPPTSWDGLFRDFTYRFQGDNWKWHRGKPPANRIKPQPFDWRDTSPYYEPFKPEAEVITGQVQRIADEYGVKLWDSPAEMYAAHPPADLSALGIEPEAPEGIDMVIRGSGGATLTLDALNKATAALQKATYTFTASLQSLSTSPYIDEPKKVSLVKAPKPTAMQRAIEAKKNRPAPPGTGIDRRKKKL